MAVSQSEKWSCSRRTVIEKMNDRMKFDDFGVYEKHYFPHGLSARIEIYI
jgi:hypothetical protein